MLQRYIRKRLGIVSPTEGLNAAGQALADAIEYAMAQPYVPPPPLTDEQRAELAAKYPDYDITAENIGAVIGIVARYGYTITIQRGSFDTGYAVLIVSPTPWSDTEWGKGGERYDSEDADELHEAFYYAFRMFCNDFDGAMRRDIAALNV